MNEEIVRDGTDDRMLRIVRVEDPGEEPSPRAQTQRGDDAKVVRARPQTVVRISGGEAADETTGVQLLPGGRQPEPEPPSGPTRAEVARVLQKARKRKRVTLEEAAAETRLPRRALATFEEAGDDADLPEPPYDRYFLREYARYLGLDDEALLLALGPPQPDELEIPLDLLPAERRPRRWPAWLLATASAAALIIRAAVRLTSSDSPALLAGGAVPEPTPAPRSEQPAQPSSPAEAAPPAIRGVSAVFRLTGPCWIQATEDGKVVMSETAPAGTTIRFHAKRTLVLRLGNGGGVRLTVNGRRVPTGATGEVVQLTFVWSNGRLTQT